MRELRFTLACLGVLVTVGHAVAEDQSCRREISASAAARLSSQCLRVAESSRWSCGTANRCRAIKNAIREGCRDLNYGQPVIQPKFCRAYIRP